MSYSSLFVCVILSYKRKMFVAKMARKSDKTKAANRSRVLHSCDPKLLEMFQFINSFQDKLPNEYVTKDKLRIGITENNIKDDPKLVFEEVEFIKKIIKLLLESPLMEQHLLKKKDYLYWCKIELEYEIKITELEISIIKMKMKRLTETGDFQFNEKRNEEIMKFLEVYFQDRLKEAFAYKNGGFCLKFVVDIELLINHHIGIKNLFEHLAFAGRDFSGARRLDVNPLFLLLPAYYLDDNGKLERRDTDFSKVLVGTDLTRIKKCYICKDFFWANRKDSQCCSIKCARVYNQRKSRENKRISGAEYRKAERKRKMKGEA